MTVVDLRTCHAEQYGDTTATAHVVGDFDHISTRAVRNGWLPGRQPVGRLQRGLFLDSSTEWDVAFEEKGGKRSLADVNAAVNRWIRTADLAIIEARDFAGKTAP